MSPSLLCLIWNRLSYTLKAESDAFHLPTWTKGRKIQELFQTSQNEQKPEHEEVCCGKNKAGRRRVVVQTTLAASLGLVTEAPAATPAGAAGDGTVGLTWEVGAVYKHAATDYISYTGITFYHTSNPVIMSKRGIGDVSSAKQEEMSISTQQDLQLLMRQLVITQTRVI